MSIFISIASYQDPVLAFTIRDAYEKAAWPDELHFGVVDQSRADTPYPVPAAIPPHQVSYVKIAPEQARGVCWARAVAMSLMGRDDWYLQIDSHTMFEQDWDQTLMTKASTLMSFTPHCVIASYPSAFHFVDGVATVRQPTSKLWAHVVAPESSFVDDNPVLRFKSRALPGLGAVEGFHVAGGGLFAPADFVAQFPYDPYLYFGEEEPALALRLFTHGWTMYHVAGLPLLHLYNEPGNTATRPLHWDVTDNDGVQPLWVRLSAQAKERMKILVSGDSSSLGAYGLGHKRTLEDYAQECGIDYIKRELHPRAYSGPWEIPATVAKT